MPSFGLRHSNRSQTQQVDSPQGHRPPSGLLRQQQPPPLAGPASASPSASAPEDKAYSPRLQPQSYSDTHIGAEQQYHQTPLEGPAGGSHYEPGESESQRYSEVFPHQQQFQQHPPNFDIDQGSSTDLSKAPGIPSQLQKQSVPSSSNSPLDPPKKSKSRSFFGFSSKSQKEQQKAQPQQQQSQHHSFSLGRSISKKQRSRPELRMQSNNSIERLQQGWHRSEGSSSGTLPSHAEQDKDEFDPFQIREDDVEPHQHYSPRQDLSVRIVDDSQRYQSFQDQQHLHSSAQYSPQQLQQYQQFSQHTTPISPDQNLEYDAQQMPSQQQPQYQQNLTFAIQPSGAFRQQNPEVVSQISHESPLDQTDDRPPSVHSTQGYQGQYPSRKTSIAGPGSGPPQNPSQQGSMAPPQAAGAQGHQGRKSTEVNKNLQPGDARGQPPGYSQGQFTPVQGQAQPVNLHSPLPPIPGQPAPAGYRNTQLRTEFSSVSDGRSTPPVPDRADSAPPSEHDKLSKFSPPAKKSLNL